MIKLNQTEAQQLIDLIYKQMAKSDFNSPVEIEVDENDINVTVKSHGGWLRSGVYRRQNLLSVAEVIEVASDMA